MALVMLGYTALVVYGSLVTRHIHTDLAFTDAVQAFRNIPYLSLGPERRQDLLANLLFYIPIGLLAAATLWPRYRNRALELSGSLLVVVLGFALAVTVEFVQLWFKRTVSLNDLIVEAIGILIGVAVWWLFWRRLLTLLMRATRSDNYSLSAALILYAVLYVVLSLFPYDFVLNPAELAAKLADYPFGFGYQCRSVAWCMVTPLLEVMLALPVGLLALLWLSGRNELSLKKLVAAGVLLGVALEFFQMLTLSGRSSILSILTRAGSFVMVYYIFQQLHLWPLVWRYIAPRLRRLVVMVVGPYLVALAVINGVSSFTIPDWEDFLEKLETTRYIPFFYHYFNSEVEALISILAQLMMYAPVGVFVWAWFYRKDRLIAGHVPAVLALAAGLATGFLMWLGRSYLSPHPFADPTNIWLAGLSAWASYLVMVVVVPRLEFDGAQVSPNIVTSTERPINTGVSPREFDFAGLARVLGAAAALLCILVVIGYPLSWLGLVVAVLPVIMLRRWPDSWLFWLPPAIALLDLGTITGELLFDELDILLLATLASLYLTRPFSTGWLQIPRLLYPLGLLLLSYCIASITGLVANPLQEDGGTSWLYLSPQYALHLLKGFLYTLLLLPWVYRAIDHDAGRTGLFLTGGLVALLGTCVLILIERHVFSGLLNFTDAYRVAVGITSSSVGGQHIDAILLMLAPTSLLLLESRHGRVGLVGFVAVMGLLLYCTFVTYSRWTWLCLLAMAAIGAIILARYAVSALAWKRIAAMVAALVIVPVILWLSLSSSSYMQQRMANVGESAETRLEHWQQALELPLGSVLQAIFGTGVGTYPREYISRLASAERPGNFRIARAEGETALKLLGGGKSTYVVQKLTLENLQPLLLTANTRGTGGGDYGMVIKICEQSLLYSKGCAITRFEGRGESWSQQLGNINFAQTSEPFRERGMMLNRPLYFVLHTPAAGSAIYVDNLRLLDVEGNNLLRNGDFASGADFWLALSDEHLLWHAKNMFIHQFVEHGLTGLLALTWLLLTFYFTGLQRGLEGNLPAIICLLAVTGFVLCGMTGSLLDASRLMTFFYLFVIVGMCNFSVPAGSIQREGAAGVGAD